VIGAGLLALILPAIAVLAGKTRRTGRILATINGDVRGYTAPLMTRLSGVAVARRATLRIGAATLVEMPVPVLALLACWTLVAFATEHRSEAGDALIVEAPEAGFAVTSGAALRLAAGYADAGGTIATTGTAGNANAVVTGGTAVDGAERIATDHDWCRAHLLVIVTRERGGDLQQQ
jgi:hypothetical protein